MRKTILTLTMILALSSITQAGIMLQPAAPPPPPAEGDMGLPLAQTIVAVIETILSFG